MSHSTFALGVLLGLGALSPVAFAADHAEAPGAAADSAADLADLYVWHDSDSVYAVITFAGLTAAGGDATYDEDVLYTLKIDNDGDAGEELSVHFRFGQDSSGAWGIQAENVPGASGTFSGAVETVITDGDAMLWAGLRDDPFFFDLAGFTDTLSTATLAFTGADALAGTNVTAIVVAMDDSIGATDGNQFRIWATTARK